MSILEYAPAPTDVKPQLTGSVDVASLARMLDQVSDIPTFQGGIASLQSGADLTAEQNKQMALAFISLLDASSQQRQQIISKLQGLALVHSAAPANTDPGSAPSPGAPANPGAGAPPVPPTPNSPAS